MLISIYVNNFVLLKDINIMMQEGFSSFTGETGAGKSLLMDAIGILKGDRFSPSFIKQNEEYALIEGVFDISKRSDIKKQLEEAGYTLEDDLLIVNRECHRDGKNKTRINQRITTISFLKTIMVQLVDLHSQHDSQSLLKVSNHQSYFNHFLHEEALLNECKQAYINYQHEKNNYEQLLKMEYDEDDLESFTNHYNMIVESQIEENELEELENQINEMSQYEQIVNALQQFDYLFQKDEGILENYYHAIQMLDVFAHNQIIHDAQSKLNDCYYVIDDVVHDLKKYQNQLFFDEANYNKLIDRVSYIKKMFRRNGGSYQSMLGKKQELEQQIDLIINHDESLKKAKKQLDLSLNNYLEIANKLHEIRIKKSKELEAKVKLQLNDLCLEKARFMIDIHRGSEAMYGYDEIIFKVAMNPGEDFKALNESISGGELSRFMLGIKGVFADCFSYDTIIFDEIDTGVSGPVAFAIGKKMAELAKKMQVLAVTHSAQVAACGHYHYKVCKKQGDHETSSEIILLDHQGRIQELANMASINVSEKSLLSAEELLTLAQKSSS